jgi:threonine synthase
VARNGAALWNRRARLHCLVCGAVEPLGAVWDGCRSCPGRRPLVVTYEDIEVPDIPSMAQALLPIRPEYLLDLGQGGTPLVPAPAVAKGMWLKLEAQNPSGSHKDRFHAIAAAIARALGYSATVTSSTGNHGAAAAAYAAAAGLRSLVCLHPESPPALRTQIRSHGGTIAVVPGHDREVIGALVDAGWYPSTGADPTIASRANPYGQEGYKAIAYELATALPELPGVVAVPAASGDTFYGIWRGFRDLHERFGRPMPTLLACQPAGSAPLALTAASGQDQPQTVADPWSLALSARDESSGWHASLALRDSGVPLAIPEESLLQAVKHLGRAGFCVEPASALAVAGIVQARAEGIVDPEAVTVAVITSSGLNWTRDLDTAWGGEPAVVTSVDELMEVIGAG